MEHVAKLCKNSVRYVQKMYSVENLHETYLVLVQDKNGTNDDNEYHSNDTQYEVKSNGVIPRWYTGLIFHVKCVDVKLCVGCVVHLFAHL